MEKSLEIGSRLTTRIQLYRTRIEEKGGGLKRRRGDNHRQGLDGILKK
jgi:hypothetical protein